VFGAEIGFSTGELVTFILYSTYLFSSQLITYTQRQQTD
jgi:hypothetical protein